jgi:hypothetical protein
MEAREFLSKAISILATSLDFPSTIDNLARLANSSISDWCAIYIFENQTSVRRLLPSEPAKISRWLKPWLTLQLLRWTVLNSIAKRKKPTG